MGFFNPLDVITGGASALPGTGVGKAAINAGKVGGGVGQGSLAALGSGVGRNAPIYNPVQPPQMPTMNPDILKRFMDPNFDPRMEPGFHDPQMPGPQPVPGMPPRQFDGPVIGTGFPGPGQPPFDPNVVINGGYGSEGPGGFTGHAQDPNFGQLGQVGGGPYGNRGSGQPLNQPMNPWNAIGGTRADSQPMGSLQSLGMNPASVGHVAQGAAQLGQMVNLRGPDGSMKAVPQSDLAHWLSKGAQVVQGAF